MATLLIGEWIMTSILLLLLLLLLLLIEEKGGSYISI
jgi:hypothetical protein